MMSSQFFFIDFMCILQTLVKWSTICLNSWTWTGCFSNSSSPSVISCWISPFVDSSIFTVVSSLVDFGIWTCVWHSHCDCREMRFICVCFRGVHHDPNTHLLLGFLVCTWFMVTYVGVIQFVFHVSKSHEEACVASTNLRWSIMNIGLKILPTLLWLSLSKTHVRWFFNRTHRSSQLCSLLSVEFLNQFKDSSLIPLKHDFFLIVFFVWSSFNRTPIKYRCLIEKSN